MTIRTCNLYVVIVNRQSTAGFTLSVWYEGPLTSHASISALRSILSTGQMHSPSSRTQGGVLPGGPRGPRLSRPRKQMWCYTSVVLHNCGVTCEGVLHVGPRDPRLSRPRKQMWCYISVVLHKCGVTCDGCYLGVHAALGNALRHLRGDVRAEEAGVRPLRSQLCRQLPQSAQRPQSRVVHCAAAGNTFGQFIRARGGAATTRVAYTTL